MGIKDSFKKIDELIRKIYSDVKNIPEDTDVQGADAEHNKLNCYIALFDLLLIDSEAEENVFAQLENTSPENVNLYIQKLYILNRLIINGLPENSPEKEILQERLLNNINVSAFERFEQAFEKDPVQAASDFIKAHKQEDVIGTVEVRTWGTEHQYGSGLKSVLEKKFRGDDVGHAALVIRIAADDEGLRLINQYCLDKDGLVKIPFELRKIGNQAVYEIYWSYWPNRLNSMDADNRSERGGLEFRDVAELERSVPRELSEHYILHKFRNDKEIPIAGASERISSKEMQTSKRARYLQLQDKMEKIEEEKESLNIILENYINEGNPYSPTETFTDIEIKKTSNFLTILKRFKKALGEDRLIAKILTERKISSEDSHVILDVTEKLIKDKRAELKKLSDDCEEILSKNHLLYKSENKIADLINQQREQFHSKESYQKIDDVYQLFTETLKNNLTDFPIKIPQKQLNILNKHEHEISQANKDSKLVFDLIKDKHIKTLDEFQEITAQLGLYKTDLLNELTSSNQKDSLQSELADLQTKYRQGKKYFLHEISEKIGLIDKELLSNLSNKNKILTELQSSYENELKRMDDKILKIVQKKQKNELALEKIKEIIIDLEYSKEIGAVKSELLEMKATASELKKIGNNFKGEKHIPYVGGNNLIVKNKIMATQLLKQKITPDIDKLVQQIVNMEKTAHKGPYTLTYSENKQIEIKSLPEARREEKNIINGIQILTTEIDKKIKKYKSDKSKLKANYEKETQKINTTFSGNEIKLKSQKISLEHDSKIIKIKSTQDYRDLRDKKLRRGIPYKSNILKGFNVEKMLQVATNQAEKTVLFKLKEDNCSTTSMKILREGAPEKHKELFISSKPPIKKEYTLKPQDPTAPMQNNIIYLSIKNGHIAYSMISKEGKNIYNHEINSLSAPTNFIFLAQRTNIKSKILAEVANNGHSAKVEYDSSAFLTNPQSVYSASRLCQQIDQGNPEAQRIAKKLRAEQKSNNRYYQLMNELTAKSDEELKKLQRGDRGSWWKIIKKFILSPSAIIGFIKDYFYPEKEKTVVVVDSLLSDMKDAIEKNLGKGKFQYVNADLPAAATFEMLLKLQQDKTNVPFIKNQCLENIRGYILQIEAKEHPTADDTLLLTTYEKVMHERNSRMAAIEDALAMGIDIKTQLLARKDTSADIAFALSPQQLIEHQVDVFERSFQQKKKESKLPGFIFDFIHSFHNKLDKLVTNQDKFMTIQAHVKEDPDSLSALIFHDNTDIDPVIQHVILKSLQQQQPNKLVNQEQKHQQPASGFNALVDVHPKPGQEPTQPIYTSSIDTTFTEQKRPPEPELDTEEKNGPGLGM